MHVKLQVVSTKWFAKSANVDGWMRRFMYVLLDYELLFLSLKIVELCVHATRIDFNQMMR